MNEQLQAKVFEYIDGLAKSLGVAAEYVFTTLVKQQVVEGIVYTSSWAIAILLIALLVRAYVRKVSDSCEDLEDWAMALMPVLLFAGTPVVLAFILLPECIMKIFNPEYYALKEILDAIGGK